MSTDDVVAGPAVLAAAGPGHVLGGRYRLDHVLGRGAMAEVWQAQDTVLARPVAVKIFHGEAASPAEQQRQHTEIRLVAALSHPNLVTVFDAGTDPACPGVPCSYLVMELVEGATLARVLGNGPLSADDIAEVGAQLASALAYVHARGIVHRDLKPANILLTATRRTTSGVTAKLTDFGIARVLDGTRVTLAGTTVGTANYLSPEQASGLDVTPASDVYSLGLVLLECLTGQLAFPGYGVEAAIARLQRAPVIPHDLDPSWQGLLAAMTARDPEIRPSAAVVGNRLRSLAAQNEAAPQGASLSALLHGATTQAMALRAGAGAPAASSGALHPSLPGRVVPRRRRPRRAAWMIAAIMVLMAAAAATLVLVVRGGAPSRGGDSTPTRPYPSVSGKLGSDLRHLQDAVS